VRKKKYVVVVKLRNLLMNLLMIKMGSSEKQGNVKFVNDIVVKILIIKLKWKKRVPKKKSRRGRHLDTIL
jgi:hypothetical protein